MQILDNISSKPTSSSKSDAFLVIDHVSKVYDTPKGKYIVLEDVNLQVKEGEFICIIGHSGCGKSTLLNMVAGFNQPTTGVISVQGQLITEPGPERMVVFQNYSLLPWLTAKENIHLGVESVYPDKSTTEQLEIVKENLELVGLSEAANKKPAQLSGGMKQRVSIARALATRPQILILDEPFGALDPITREELQEELLNIWQDHRITVLMITHDIDEALFLADRLVMMTNGPAAQIGEILDIPFSRPRNRAKIMEDPRYYELRNYALDFLFRRFAHHEEDEETTEEIIPEKTEETTPDMESAQSTTIAASSSHRSVEVLKMQPNKPNPNENPYAKPSDATPSEPELTYAADPAPPTPSEEMSPAMKTGILFGLWGVIIATLVGSLVLNPTSTTTNQEAETTESPSEVTATTSTSAAETVTPITTPSPTLSPSPIATLSPSPIPTVSPSPSLGSTPTSSPNTIATTSPSPDSLATTTPSSTTATSPTTTTSPSLTASPSPVATASPTPESLTSATTSPSVTATSPTTTVSPVSEATSSPTDSTNVASSTTAATPSAQELEQLNEEVFATINESWTSTPVTAVSVYIVKVSRTGDILSYEAQSPDATQNVNNTPLPKLVKSDVTQTPYTQFEATFTPAGTLEIKPAQ